MNYFILYENSNYNQDIQRGDNLAEINSTNKREHELGYMEMQDFLNPAGRGRGGRELQLLPERDHYKPKKM